MSRNELKVRIHQLETELMRDRIAEQKLMTMESKLREAHHELFQAQFALGSVRRKNEAFEKMDRERMDLKKKNRERHEKIGEMVRVKKGLEMMKMEEAKDDEIMKLKKELEKMRMRKMKLKKADYEDFVRRGARVGEIAADETDVEDEAGPSGCNAPSDDVEIDEPGPSNRKMAEYHNWSSIRSPPLFSSPHNQNARIQRRKCSIMSKGGIHELVLKKLDDIADSFGYGCGQTRIVMFEGYDEPEPEAETRCKRCWKEIRNAGSNESTRKSTRRNKP